jgi:hypothetical protein
MASSVKKAAKSAAKKAKRPGTAFGFSNYLDVPTPADSAYIKYECTSLAAPAYHRLGPFFVREPPAQFLPAFRLSVDHAA